MNLVLSLLLASASTSPAKTLAEKKSTQGQSPKHAKAKKVLSIEALIAKAMREGISKSVNVNGERRLGYTKPHRSRKLQYDDKASGDGYHHRFQVVLIDADERPQDVILGKIRAIEMDGAQRIEEYSFRMDLKGKLLAAVKGYGPPKALTKENLSTGDDATQKAFLEELGFFRNHASSLPMAKVE